MTYVEISLRFCEKSYSLEDLDSIVCHPFINPWEVPGFMEYNPTFSKRTAFDQALEDRGYDAE